MPKRRRVNLNERVHEATKCVQCGIFLVQTTGAKASTHDILDLVDQFHNNGHDNSELRPSKSVRKAVSASKVVTAPPSSSTAETHKFQSIFVEVVKEYLPENDKLDPFQEVVVNEEVTMAVLERTGWARTCFRPTELYGEEQARPAVSALVEGIVSLVAADEEGCIACECPVKYFVETMDENGEVVLTQVSPPGEEAVAQHELLSKAASHDERKEKASMTSTYEGIRQTWKKDFVISSSVRTLDKHGMTKLVWIPRVHVETKGDAANAGDLFQASTSGWKLQLKRLQDREIIGRLYVEVWGTVSFYYGIQDIFGYVTVDNGLVTPESFALYEETVRKYRAMWGEAFPEKSLLRCPQTLREMQALYDQTAREYKDKWKQPLPSMNTMEDFPVGVVYFNQHMHPFPTGKLPVPPEHAAVFIQGHVRILASNWAIPRDPTAHAAANARLLENHRKFIERVKAESAKMVFRQGGPRTKLPDRVVFKSFAEAGVSRIGGPIGEAAVSVLTETGETSSSPLSFTIGIGEAAVSVPTETGETSSSPPSFTIDLENPPSRGVVKGWTNEEVKQLVRVACGGPDEAVDEAVAASQIDGLCLLAMSSADLDFWFTEIRLQRTAPRARIRGWLESVRSLSF